MNMDTIFACNVVHCKAGIPSGAYSLHLLERAFCVLLRGVGVRYIDPPEETGIGRHIPPHLPMSVRFYIFEGGLI